MIVNKDAVLVNGVHNSKARAIQAPFYREKRYENRLWERMHTHSLQGFVDVQNQKQVAKEP